MRTIFRVILIIIVIALAASALFSVIRAVLGITTGFLGATFRFVWRIIFSPVILILLIVWLVVRVRKKPC